MRGGNMPVGADSISARKPCGCRCVPRANNVRPYRMKGQVCNKGKRAGRDESLPYEGKMQWRLTLSGGPGMPGPYGDVE